jgi:IS1 family transposase
VKGTAVSRYTGQVLTYVLGDRSWKHVEKLVALLPPRYQRRTVYTDGYEANGAFFWPSRHRQCQKFDGGTSGAEGVNTSLRHRCSFLVRRQCGPRARCPRTPSVYDDFAQRNPTSRQVTPAPSIAR